MNFGDPRINFFLLQSNHSGINLFAPRTPKSQYNFHGHLKCHYEPLAGPLIPVKEVQIGTVLYFSDLHGPPRPPPWTP